MYAGTAEAVGSTPRRSRSARALCMVPGYVCSRPGCAPGLAIRRYAAPDIGQVRLASKQLVEGGHPKGSCLWVRLPGQHHSRFHMMMLLRPYRPGATVPGGCQWPLNEPCCLHPPASLAVPRPLLSLTGFGLGFGEAGSFPGFCGERGASVGAIPAEIAISDAHL